MGWPFSFNAVSMSMLLDGECRSATDLAITTPFTFCHGPFPMRSRALMPWDITGRPELLSMIGLTLR
jgi:hypothetical protein